MNSKKLTMQELLRLSEIIAVDEFLQRAINGTAKSIDTLKTMLKGYVNHLHDHEEANIQDIVRRLESEVSYLRSVRRTRTSSACRRAIVKLGKDGPR